MHVFSTSLYKTLFERRFVTYYDLNKREMKHALLKFREYDLQKNLSVWLLLGINLYHDGGTFPNYVWKRALI